MAQQSARRGRENQGFPQCFEHALGDLDPTRELPYRPAADHRCITGRTDGTIRLRATTILSFSLPRRGRPQIIASAACFERMLLRRKRRRTRRAPGPDNARCAARALRLPELPTPPSTLRDSNARERVCAQAGAPAPGFRASSERPRHRIEQVPWKRYRPDLCQSIAPIPGKIRRGQPPA